MAKKTNETTKTKIEQFGDAFLTAIQKRTMDIKVTNEAGKKTYAFEADFGRNNNQYKIVCEQVPDVNGKINVKRNLYVYDKVLGKDRAILFGPFKRKYLYAATHSLEKNTSAPRNFVVDKAFVTKIMQTIRANNADFNQTIVGNTSTITGKVDDKSVEIKTTEVDIKGGHKIKRHTLMVDGQLMGSGCMVSKVFFAYNNPYKGRPIAERQASADASVNDLI